MHLSTTLIVTPRPALTLPASLIATERVHVQFDTTTPSEDDDFASGLREPAHGQIAQRRVDSKDSFRARAAARDCATWRRENGITEDVVWTETEWTREQHPGVLIEAVKEEEEYAPEEVPFWVRWRSSRGSMMKGRGLTVEEGEVSPKTVPGRKLGAMGVGWGEGVEVAERAADWRGLVDNADPDVVPTSDDVVLSV